MIPSAAPTVRREAAPRRWPLLVALALLAVAATLLAMIPAGPSAAGTVAAAACRAAPVASVGAAAPETPSSVSRDRACVEAVDVAAPADQALPDPAGDPSIVRATAGTVYPIRPETDPRPVAGGSPLRPPRAA